MIILCLPVRVLTKPHIRMARLLTAVATAAPQIYLSSCKVSCPNLLQVLFIFLLQAGFFLLLVLLPLFLLWESYGDVNQHLELQRSLMVVWMWFHSKKSRWKQLNWHKIVWNIGIKKSLVVFVVWVAVLSPMYCYFWEILHHHHGWIVGHRKIGGGHEEGGEGL